MQNLLLFRLTNAIGGWKMRSKNNNDNRLSQGSGVGGDPAPIRCNVLKHTVVLVSARQQSYAWQNNSSTGTLGLHSLSISINSPYLCCLCLRVHPAYHYLADLYLYKPLDRIMPELPEAEVARKLVHDHCVGK